MLLAREMFLYIVMSMRQIYQYIYRYR